MQRQSEPKAVAERYARRNQAIMDLRYSPLNPEVIMSRQEKERELVRWVKQAGLSPLNSKRLLEVGCGTGSNLIDMIRLGFLPENVVGNELLEERFIQARYQLPEAVKLLPGDASAIDILPNSFDVVFQSTVFTSLLDETFQRKLADRMWEWVKPGGGVLWYDFIYNNPYNNDVKGVSLSRIRELFPKGRLCYRRVTLAPPISRRVCRVHPELYTLFNSLPFLRTHVLCWITKSEN
jgi:SAM-dependent methyltransferase